jgi:hypothetical protein
MTMTILFLFDFWAAIFVILHPASLLLSNLQISMHTSPGLGFLCLPVTVNFQVELVIKPPGWMLPWNVSYWLLRALA